MNSLIPLLIFQFYTIGLSALPKASFERVLRVHMENYENMMLKAFDNATNLGECAKLCQYGCLSFAFDSNTMQCKTFAWKFCVKNAAPKPSTTMLFTKLEPRNCNPVNCSELNPGIYNSGVYKLLPSAAASLDVFCDMDTPDGPWTVIQNRANGDENFYRDWEDYTNGFGSIDGNFWLGNEVIHQLTATPSVLRMEMTAWTCDSGHAQYSTFSVGNEATNYLLTVSGFSGNVSHDSMSYHDGMMFSTFDRDNDQWPGKCSESFKGAFWYNGCFGVNPNGALYTSEPDNLQTMVWHRFYNDIIFTGLKHIRMLVKPLNP